MGKSAYFLFLRRKTTASWEETAFSKINKLLGGIKLFFFTKILTQKSITFT